MKRLLALALVLGLALSGLAQAGTILIVSDQNWSGNRSSGGSSPAPEGTFPEDDFAAFLGSLGHLVHVSGFRQYREGNEGSAGVATFVADNAVDLVIVSRVTDSGQYDEGNNGTNWNGLDVPLILMGPHLSRNNRWKWLPTGNATTGLVEDVKIVGLGDPFEASLTSGGYVTYNGTTDPGNGDVIGTTLADQMWLVTWDAGTEFYAGSGQTAGALRVLLGGIPYHETHGGVDMTFGHYTPEGMGIIAEVVNTAIPEPATIALLGLGGLALVRRKR